MIVVQTHVKEIHSDDKIFQSQRGNIFVCNTDEGKLVRGVITDYMKIC